VDESFLISCFGEDESGELYICDYSGGRIQRLQDAKGAPPTLTGSRFQSDPIYADPGEVVDFHLHLINSGGDSNSIVEAAITLPPGLDVVSGSEQASSGDLVLQSINSLIWQGFLTPGIAVDITYQATVTTATKNKISQTLVSGSGYTSMVLKHALLIPRPVVGTTSDDFILPGSQPGTLEDPVLLPASCDVCHTAAIFNSWQGSMMSQAGRDPLFWAALEVANHDVPGSGEFCLRCHTPKGWLEGRSLNADGSLLEPGDLEAGVSCEICHRAIDPVPSTNPDDQAVLRDAILRASVAEIPVEHIGNAMFLLDPQDYRRGPFDLGINFSYHPNQTYRSDFLGGDPENVLARSRLCGTCHNVDNPFLSWNDSEQEYLPNSNASPAPNLGPDELFAIETTYEEWLNSEYAFTTACQDCHMPRTSGYGAEAFFNPPLRDCGQNGCLPVHEFTGGNSWVPLLLQDARWRLNRQDLAVLLNATAEKARAMLRRSAQIKIGPLSLVGPNQQVTIRVVNFTGHKLPTGYTEGRRMWLEVMAFDADGNQIYSTCSYNPMTGQLVEDQDCIIFESKQAVTQKLVDALGLDIPVGESFHFMLNNSVYKDNRIPPAGFTAQALARRSMQPMINGLPAPDLYQPGQNYFERVYLLPGDTVQVSAILRYQTASKEYVEFLRDNGGVDAQRLYDIWLDLKSPPEFVAWGSYPSYPIFFPVVNR
jgi:hypothetical protein